MITEKDLSRVLHDTVDLRVAFDPDAALARVRAAEPRHPRPLAAVGAATSVLLVAGAVVGVEQLQGAPSARVTQPAATGPRSTMPLPAQAPTSSASSSPSSTGPLTSAPTSSPATAFPKTKFVIVTAKHISAVDVRTDVEYVTTQAGTSHIEISAFGPGRFSAARVSGAQPVVVDGHDGLFGTVSVWPVNGRPDPLTGKQNSALPSLAWRVGSSWVVLQIDNPTYASKQQLLAAAKTITVRPAN